MPYKPYGRGFQRCAMLMILLSPLGVPLAFVTMIIVAIMQDLNRYDCHNLRITNGLKTLFSHTSIRESHVAPTTTVSDTRDYD